MPGRRRTTMNRADYDRYLAAFNARDYDGVCACCDLRVDPWRAETPRVYVHTPGGTRR